MLIGSMGTLSSFTIAQELTETSNRLEARLDAVIAVDASGQARLDIAPGMVNDRFTAEVEIAKDDFDAWASLAAMASETRWWSCASCAAAPQSSATAYSSP